MFKKAIPTVAAALAGFEKVRAELRAVKDHHDGIAAKSDTAIVAAEEKVKQVIAAAEKAAADAIAAASRAKDAAELEAREAVQALARFEAILGL